MFYLNSKEFVYSTIGNIRKVKCITKFLTMPNRCIARPEKHNALLAMGMINWEPLKGTDIFNIF